METTKLADFFEGWRKVIESAETPFQKLAIFILPIISPMVPASFTGLHMFKLLLQVFGEGQRILAGALAFIVALVLELLGYVGAVTFIKSVFDLVRNGKDEYLVPVVINFFAYVFYLVLMFMVNVKLGEYFQTPKIINSIIGWLSFITVPTSLLAANHLSSKERKEDDEKEADKDREFKLKKAALRKGINIFDEPKIVYHSETKKEERKKSDWRQLTPQEKHEAKHILSVGELMEKYDVGKATAYAWKSDKYQV